MFGTPNHGAVTGASLNHLLLSILHSTAKGIVGFFHTGAGVLELTEVHKVFAAPLQRRQQADGIEYVTVPGTCFNESRHRLDFGGIHPTARALGIMNPMAEDHELLHKIFRQQTCSWLLRQSVEFNSRVHHRGH